MLSPQNGKVVALFSFVLREVISRGGVEDTRLEAKDTKKNPRTAFPRTDTLEAKDTSASALQKKKRSSQKFFRRSPQKNVFQKIFQALHKILTIQKIVLSSSRGQGNFRGLEASRPRPRTSKCVLEDSTSGYNGMLKHVKGFTMKSFNLLSHCLVT